MKENTYIDNELAARILSGEAGIEEAGRLQEILASNAEAQKEWDKLKHSWDLPADLLEMQSIDVDRAWGRFKNRIAGDPLHHTRPAEKKVFWLSHQRFLRVAAMFISLLATGAVTYYLLNNHPGEAGMLTASNSNSSPVTVLLPDGTEVTLNHGTTLDYPPDFKGSLREVKLSGEAFFEVKPDKLKPFIVQTPNVTIRVVGTSFNVSAYKNKPVVSVVVETGKVEFFANNKPAEKILVEPGNRGTFSRQSNRLEHALNKDVNFLSWKTRNIIFKNTPLPEVAEVLKDVYNIEIRLDAEKFANTPFDGDFRGDSIETIVKVLRSSSLAYGYQVIQKGNSIEIK